MPKSTPHLHFLTKFIGKSLKGHWDALILIEVLEREDAYTMTFPQAQAEIRKQLTKDKREKQREDQIRKIREITPVWTMWPEDIPGSKDLKEIQ